jgi:fatty acid desaturase
MGQVRARSDVWGVYLVCHAWAVIVAAIALVVWQPHVLTYLLAVALIGSRQLGLLILMHDAAHGALGNSRWVNHGLAQWACAFPTLGDTTLYRPYHLKHHAHTLGEDDPDTILTGHYPISRGSLRRKLWRDVSGQTGFAQRKQQLRDALGAGTWGLPRRWQHFWAKLGPQALTNLLLLGLALLAGHAWVYFALWLLPLLTWQQLVLRLRNIAEHAVVRGADDAFGNARTTLANPLERVFVAPYWVNYHLEHHLLMWVPCYRLRLFRKFLIENGQGAKIETAASYLEVLRKVTFVGSDPPRDGPRKRAHGTFASGFDSA